MAPHTFRRHASHLTSLKHGGGPRARVSDSISTPHPALRPPPQTLAKELAAELTKEWAPLVENLQKACFALVTRHFYFSTQCRCVLRIPGRVNDAK